jgi:hypothetical protein
VRDIGRRIGFCLSAGRPLSAQPQASSWHSPTDQRSFSYGAFGGDASHKPLHVDDEAFVGALTDTLVVIVGLDPEEQSPPIALREGRSDGDPYADRGGRQVPDVDGRRQS